MEVLLIPLLLFSFMFIIIYNDKNTLLLINKFRIFYKEEQKLLVDGKE